MTGCMLLSLGGEQAPRRSCLIWKAPNGAARIGRLCNDKVRKVPLARIIFSCLLISSLSLLSCSSDSNGTIKGYVLLPNEIDMSASAKEAKVYIYLRDVTPVGGKKVLPWEAPIKKILAREIRPLKDHRIDFEFKELTKGVYAVSVLIDTGRPHVPRGSHNFTAHPGDYAGGVEDNIKLEGNETFEVSIESGMYISIPDGYTAPLYFSD